MLVQVREGSSAQNLDALLPLLAAGELEDAWCLVTDDIFPNDLRRHGHIDGLLRRVVAGGVSPAAAVRHASFVPARHYGLIDRGAVAPGYRADLVVVDDLADFRIRTVLKGGKVVARDGKCVPDGPAPLLERENTVHLGPLDERAFTLPLAAEICPVIEIVPDQIITRHTRRAVRRVNGQWAFDPERDILYDRQYRTAPGVGPDGLGPRQRFRTHARRRARFVGRTRFAQPRDRRDQRMRYVGLCSGAGRSRRRLRCRRGRPGAGDLASARRRSCFQLDDADVVCRQLEEVNRAAHALGCPLDAPFGTLSFLALPVIPEIRITTQGVFDVREQSFLTL